MERVGSFLQGRALSRDKVYRKLRKFVDREVSDGRRTSADFPEEGLYIERDEPSGDWAYYVEDEGRFLRFVLRLTEYEVLANEDIERLERAARLAYDGAYERRGVSLNINTRERKKWTRPIQPEWWNRLNQTLAKLE